MTADDSVDYDLRPTLGQNRREKARKPPFYYHIISTGGLRLCRAYARDV